MPLIPYTSGTVWFYYIVVVQNIYDWQSIQIYFTSHSMVAVDIHFHNKPRREDTNHIVAFNPCILERAGNIAMGYGTTKICYNSGI